MVLISNLTQELWVKGNYTDNTTEGLSGVIYSEEKMVNAFDASGYTAKIRLYDQMHQEVFSDDIVWTTQASGAWEYLPALGKLNFDFIGDVEIELIKSDAELTAVGVNGSSKLRIR
jgi:hypothetical protein